MDSIPSLQNLAARALPKKIQFIWDACDGNILHFLEELESITDDVTIQGRFHALISRVAKKWPDKRTEGFSTDVPCFPFNFINKFEKTIYGYHFRWDDVTVPEWWAEFDYIEADPKKSFFRGRNIPVTKVLSYFSEDEKNFYWRWDDPHDLAFWAEIIVKKNSFSSKKSKNL